MHWRVFILLVWLATLSAGSDTSGADADRPADDSPIEPGHIRDAFVAEMDALILKARIREMVEELGRELDRTQDWVCNISSRLCWAMIDSRAKAKKLFTDHLAHESRWDSDEASHEALHGIESGCWDEERTSNHTAVFTPCSSDGLPIPIDPGVVVGELLPETE